jgi:PIN domain nuclease of toxin-antitoxin system
MLLLDTCTLLWLVADQKKLSVKATRLISTAKSIFVSSISAFEIGIKHEKKLLLLPKPPMEWFESVLTLHGLTEIPVNGRIALQATQLPPIHRDPADRILLATALEHHLSILSPDSLFKGYSNIETIW